MRPMYTCIEWHRELLFRSLSRLLRSRRVRLEPATWFQGDTSKIIGAWNTWLANNGGIIL
jgi:hypothetical protein